ncbi:MAG: hypothetical protein IT383_05135 [Deltaproteobacteria bacterium]|nr:hypothetical protein [Deltaproteobacteria bacterium]
MTTASAPGKLVLCGEYAVLEGHAAVVAAVDVRARAAIAAAPSAPLVAAVCAAARSRGLVVPAAIAVDTAAFSAGGRKLGLGSSAAAAVAAAGLIVHGARGALDAGTRELTWQIARDAHRAFQGGGSGIDVAAACYGGLLRFSTAEQPTAAPPLPGALELLVVDTLSSTSTQGFVDRVLALPDRDRRLAPLAHAALAFMDACAADDADALLAAVEQACSGMGELGAAAGVDVVSAAHARIATLASAHGGAAKPSGAGGGDVAVAFVPRERRAALASTLAQAGLPVLPLHVDERGVMIED